MATLRPGLQAVQGAPLPATQAEPAPRATVKPLVLTEPCQVMVVGDSLAITLALSMERAFKGHDGLALVAKGKIASGLQNPQYYNWEQAMGQFLREFSPQAVVVMMGANDAKYLSLDPEASTPTAARDRRLAAYEARARRFLAVMDDRGRAQLLDRAAHHGRSRVGGEEPGPERRHPPGLRGIQIVPLRGRLEPLGRRQRPVRQLPHRRQGGPGPGPGRGQDPFLHGRGGHHRQGPHQEEAEVFSGLRPKDLAENAGASGSLAARQ